MAKQKLTQTIDELISDTENRPEPKPLAIEVVSRSDVDPATVSEPEGEREVITRTRPEKPQTVTASRVVKVGDQTFTLQRRDPYGLIYVQADQGRTADALKGAYTSFGIAEQDILVYMTNR